MSESELIGITGHATVKMVRHYIETSGSSAVSAAKSRNAERNRTRQMQRSVVADGNAAAILANAIQAVLAAPALTPEAKNAAIAAITAANATNCGSLSQQNTPDFSGDKLPLVAS